MDIPQSDPVSLRVEGVEKQFDLDDPVLPDWISETSLSSGDYPYAKRMKRGKYETELESLQKELVKLQYWMRESGARIIIIFEGRDSAGKGGTISRFRQYMNPRHTRTVALSKPSDVERGQWYYQRYIDHFPTQGEMVLFDRSWYNRAGVEPVMGFCTPEQHQKFLAETPKFETMIRDEGIHFFKIWLNIGQTMQLKRFHDRRHNPLKVWKLSPIDIKALTKWDDYTVARNRMMRATHNEIAPWTVVRSNDKRRARINVIRKVLTSLDYAGKNPDIVGEMDTHIIGDGPIFFDQGQE